MLIMKMRSKNGFTVVEILVVITTLSIIASMLVISYMSIQKQSRDGKREASAVSISESLERYYADHGEYPNVATVTNPDAALVKQTLRVPTINSLLGPNAPAGSNTNAWKTGVTSSTNQLTYAPNTDTSSGCVAGLTPADVCANYRLQYYKEETGTIGTIYSRY